MRRAAILIALGVLQATSPVLAGPGVKVGEKAPEVSAPSWLNLPKGLTTISSEELKGKVLFVEFWATW
jgi:hypothetical protein